MSVKISQLPSASSVTSDDFFPIVDSGSLTTQKATAQQILDYVTSSTFGNLKVSGTIEADELIISQITTASVIYSSGSSKFGDELTDKHEFTGSVYVSGNLNVDGFLSASSFTGSFSGSYFGLTGSSTSFPNFSQDVRNQLSGAGSINYDPNTGIISSSALTSAVIEIQAGDNIVVTSGSGPISTISLTSSITGGLTDLTASNISSSLLKTTVLSSSTGEFSGNILIYGTAILDQNPNAAYVKYESSIDKITIFPGLNVSGSAIVSGNLEITGNLSASSITGSSATFDNIQTNTISASNYIGINLPKLVVNTDTILAVSERAVFVTNDVSSSVSITLPSSSLADSREYYIIKADSLSGSVIISASSPDLINGQSNYSLNGPFQSVVIINDGANWFIF